MVVAQNSLELAFISSRAHVDVHVDNHLPYDVGFWLVEGMWMITCIILSFLAIGRDVDGHLDDHLVMWTIT